MTRTLSRPRILTRAAKAGAALYKRERDLGRILPKLTRKVAKPALINAIAEAEERCEAERSTGSATYSLTRHISLLSALLAESGGRAAA